MESDRLQMISTLLYAMIDGILIFDELLIFIFIFFLSILPLDFTCLSSTDEVRGIYFCVVRASVRPLRPSVRTFVRPEPYLSTYLSYKNHSFYK